MSFLPHVFVHVEKGQVTDTAYYMCSKTQSISILGSCIATRTLRLLSFDMDTLRFLSQQLKTVGLSITVFLSYLGCHGFHIPQYEAFILRRSGFMKQVSDVYTRSMSEIEDMEGLFEGLILKSRRFALRCNSTREVYFEAIVTFMDSLFQKQFPPLNMEGWTQSHSRPFDQERGEKEASNFASQGREVEYQKKVGMNRDEWNSILPQGLSVKGGEPPPPPPSFEEGYSLPVHCEKPLQTVNRSPLDEKLRFFEEPHVYTWESVPFSSSVTSLAHQYEQPFYPEEAIQKMKSSRSQSWPRLEYVLDAKPLQEEEWTCSRGALLVLDGKTISSLPPFSMREGSTRENMRRMLVECSIKGNSGEGGEIYTFERCCTDDEIVKGWRRKGMLASNKGTEAHYQAELFFNGLPCRDWEDEMKVVLRFAREKMIPSRIVSFNTEKEIVCLDADLAGSIDLLLYDERRGVHHIVDHKRSDKLKKDLRGFGKMAPPFQHLDDCKGAGYALQTSIYQYILERDYGMKIGERILLSLHPDLEFVTTVPYMEKEVQFIMESRFAIVAARKRVAEEERFRCCLSGAPAVDAVRLKRGGGIAMEKAALLKGEEYEEDKETRSLFEERVVTLLPLIELEKGCVSWRKQMPESGIEPLSSS